MSQYYYIPYPEPEEEMGKRLSVPYTKLGEEAGKSYKKKEKSVSDSNIKKTTKSVTFSDNVDYYYLPCPEEDFDLTMINEEPDESKQ